MAQQAIGGVLFDKDGTLFDFHATWARLTEAVLETLAPDAATGIEMARAAGYDPQTRRFVPGSIIVAEPTSALAQLWSRWRPDLGPEAIEAMANDAAAAAADLAIVPAAADLPGLLAGLRRRNLALGVATHDEERSARAQLTAAGVLDAFDFIAGYDSGHGLKPGPGMLFAFAAATGVPAGSVVVVGDSRHDLQMAQAAGALAVGVLTGPAGHAELAPFTSRVLASIDDLPALLDSLGTPLMARKAT